MTTAARTCLGPQTGGAVGTKQQSPNAPSAKSGNETLAPELKKLSSMESPVSSDQSVVSFVVKPSYTVFWVAGLVSFTWLTYLASTAVSSHTGQLEVEAGAVSGFAWQSLGHVAGTDVFSWISNVVAPLSLIWAIAFAVRAGQKMQLAAQGMFKLVSHFTSAESQAHSVLSSVSQSVQSVRKDVSALSENLDNVISRAGELETLVHGEVSFLERSCMDNETRIKKLLNDLRVQHDDITEHTSHLRTSLSGVSADVADSMEKLTSSVTESLTGSMAQIKEDLERKGKEVAGVLSSTATEVSSDVFRQGRLIADNLSTACDNAVSKLSSTEIELSQRFSTTSQSVTELVEENTERIIRELGDKATAVVGTIEDTSNNLSSSVSFTGDKVIKIIEDQVSHLNNSVEGLSSNLDTRIDIASGQFSETLMKYTDQCSIDYKLACDSVIDDLSTKTELIKENLLSSGESVAESLAFAGTSAAENFTKSVASAVNDIETSGVEICSSLKESVVSVNQLISSTGSEVVSSIVQQNVEVVDAIHTIGESLGVELSLRHAEIAGNLETTAARMVNDVAKSGTELIATLSNITDSLDANLNVHGADLAKQLGALGAQLHDTVTLNGMQLVNSLKETDTNLTEVMNSRLDSMRESLHFSAKTATADLQYHTEFLSEALRACGVEVLEKAVEQKTLVVDEIKDITSHLTSSILGKTSEFSDVIGKNLAQLDHIVNTQTGGMVEELSGFASSITKQAGEIKRSVEENLYEFKQFSDVSLNKITTAITEKSSELDEIARKHEQEIVTAFDTGASRAYSQLLDKTKEQMLPMINRQSMQDMAKTVFDEVMSDLSGQFKGYNKDLIASVRSGMDDIGNVFVTRMSKSLEMLDKRCTALQEMLKTGMSGSGSLVVQNGNGQEQSVSNILGEISSCVEALGLDICQILSRETSAVVKTIDERAISLEGRLESFLKSVDERVEGTSDNFEMAIVKSSDRAISAFNDKGHQLISMYNSFFKEQSELVELQLQDIIEKNTVPVVEKLNRAAEVFVGLIDRDRESEGNLVISDAAIVEDDLGTGRDITIANAVTLKKDLFSSIDQYSSSFSESVSGVYQGLVKELTKRMEGFLGDLSSVRLRLIEQMDESLRDVIVNVASQGERLSTELREEGKRLTDAVHRSSEDLSRNARGAIQESEDSLKKAIEKVNYQSGEMKHLTSSLEEAAASSLKDAIRAVEHAGTQFQTIQSAISDTVNEVLSIEAKNLVNGLDQNIRASLEAVATQLNKVSEVTRAHGNKSKHALEQMQQVITSEGAKVEEATTALSHCVETMQNASILMRTELDDVRIGLRNNASVFPRELHAVTESMKLAVNEQLKAVAKLSEDIKESRAHLNSLTNVQNRNTEPKNLGAVHRDDELFRKDDVISGTFSSCPTSISTNGESRRQFVSVLYPTQPGTHEGSASLISPGDPRDASYASSQEEESSNKINGKPGDIHTLFQSIVEAINHETFIAAWKRYYSGERGVFDDNLYTLQGRKVVDKIRHMCDQEPEFRAEVDKYIVDFNRLLKKKRSDRASSDVSSINSQSDTDSVKVFTCLAQIRCQLK